MLDLFVGVGGCQDYPDPLFRAVSRNPEPYHRKRKTDLPRKRKNFAGSTRGAREPRDMSGKSKELALVSVPWRRLAFQFCQKFDKAARQAFGSFVSWTSCGTLCSLAHDRAWRDANARESRWSMEPGQELKGQKMELPVVPVEAAATTERRMYVTGADVEMYGPTTCAQDVLALQSVEEKAEDTRIFERLRKWTTVIRATLEETSRRKCQTEETSKLNHERFADDAVKTPKTSAEVDLEVLESKVSLAFQELVDSPIGVEGSVSSSSSGRLRRRQ